jgi:hypothetical protein
VLVLVVESNWSFSGNLDVDIAVVATNGADIGVVGNTVVVVVVVVVAAGGGVVVVVVVAVVAGGGHAKSAVSMARESGLLTTNCIRR